MTAFTLELTLAGVGAEELRAVADKPPYPVHIRQLPAAGNAHRFSVSTCGYQELESLRGLLSARFGGRLIRCSDPLLEQAVHGKLRIRSTVPLDCAQDLAIAYTPGVGRLVELIAADPPLARELTGRANRVAVVSDGTAVLGFGDMGPDAALPVMEGKAALFARLADIDAVPLCLNVHDVDSIVATVAAMAPSFGGINLEDIAAPVCFDVERRLADLLDIPVFHDDQHGTAIVVLAALLNSLRRLNRELGEERIVVIGAGAAGTAVTRLLLAAGAGDVIVCTPTGVLCAGHTDDLPEHKKWLAEHTNPRRVVGGIAQAMAGAQTVIGVSRPGALSRDLVLTMDRLPVIFALANPVPEIEPALVADVAGVIATGRSDDPNQVNNVLAFPGVFRGLLDSGARRVSTAMKLSAARALAALSDPTSEDRILPDVFDPRVVPAVAASMSATMPPAGAGEPTLADAQSEPEQADVGWLMKW